MYKKYTVNNFFGQKILSCEIEYKCINGHKFNQKNCSKSHGSHGKQLKTESCAFY